MEENKAAIGVRRVNVEAIKSLSFNESDALFLMACRQWNIHRILGWKGFFSLSITGRKWLWGAAGL